jgi:hypothetical protein
MQNNTQKKIGIINLKLNKYKILFFINFLFISNASYAQIYYSHYLDETSEWRSYNTTVYGTTYYTSYFDGTENHNGYTYHKRYTVINENGNIYVYPSYSLYREDSNGKFYYLNLNTNIDEVDIDNNLLLNAQIGDLFNSFGVLYYDNENCSVTSINTINLNGLNIKHLIGNFDNSTGLVEGIGRISNPCYPSLDAWGGLACYTIQNQTIQFGNINCNLFPSAQRQNLSLVNFENNNIKIFPNPAKTIVTISTNNKNIDEITLCDIQGRFLKTDKVNNTNTQFDISNYQSGTYIIIVKTDIGISKTKLIIN